MKTALINSRRQVGQRALVPQWPKSAVRIGFGLIWLIDAAFKWSPDFRTGILGMVKDSSTGQPSWLHGWFHFWISAVQAHPHAWAYMIAVIETLIALALIFGFARKATYIVTILTALFIWGIAEGFGGPYSSTSTDIGAAVMYAVVAFALLVLQLQFGPSRYSVDYWLEQRVSWWHWVAEFGAHWHPAPGETGPALVASVASTSPATPAGENGGATLVPTTQTRARSSRKTNTLTARHGAPEAHVTLAVKSARLREVTTELIHRRHLPISEQRRWMGSVLRGHYNYTSSVPAASENGAASTAAHENGSPAMVRGDSGSIAMVRGDNGSASLAPAEVTAATASPAPTGGNGSVPTATDQNGSAALPSPEVPVMISH